jgi:CRISPR-associated protein Cas1
MTRQLLNTLYVMTQGAYLHLDRDTVRVEVEQKTQLQVPLHHLGGIVCFGDTLVSPALIGRCADDGRSLVFMDQNGRFKARIEGSTSGNVLLRRAQHTALDAPGKPAAIARNIVAAKNRHVVMRAARDTKHRADSTGLQEVAELLANILAHLSTATDLDEIRGLEGEAARAYFEKFDLMVRREERKAFAFKERSRRPPRDRTNALLSFLYALLLSDCTAGAEGVGLDPQIGYLHALRPGRPALSLDLMEEFRSAVADRLALTLINRQQITSSDFEDKPGGVVHLSEKGRKEIVIAYQRRKQDEVDHRALGSKVPVGLLPHVQARILARHLRGDIPQYLPFVFHS